MFGLYDSGIGGLSVLSALRAAGVDQDIVYFADQAHVPYGSRTDQNLHELLTENFTLLATHGIDVLVMACNTSCAVAARMGWPDAPFRVLDLIGNAADSLRDTAATSVAVFATAATVRSQAYSNAIRRVAPHVTVHEIAAPALVPLVEAGGAGTPQAQEAVTELVRALPTGLDAIVYGCTHYPMLDREFAAALAPAIERIDPARAQAAATVASIRDLGLAAGTGVTHYLTNGDVVAFERNVRAWTGDARGRVSFAGALAL